jgi:DNA-binding CsgD family transcriptional regulator/tetratricopeptide (TPR) repeat protein
VEARASEVFIGRLRELGELERALDAARDGHGAAILIAGEAGIGKTRLVSELATRARETGCEVHIGRSIDLVGAELPYQPFVEALRPLGRLWQVGGRTPSSQLQVFEEALTLVTDRAAAAPVLLVLEDLHWADTSTLDLVVFLAHNVDDRPMLLLATSRADERASTERIRRLADGVRRSSSGLVLELGPLERDELAALVAAHAADHLTTAATSAIAARSEGNPFFAEELLAAASEGSGELPLALRHVLLQRVDGVDPRTQGLLRVAAAAGRDVDYAMLCATAGLPEPEVRESLRQAIDHGVLTTDPGTQMFRFRHALLAEAIYETVLPGEREELHGRLAEELALSDAAGPAELAPHWAAAGRPQEALVTSIEAARQAEAVFGLPEGRAHVERALALWDSVPAAAELVGLDLDEVCAWAAELASRTGDAPRAVELTRRAIELVGESDRLGAAVLHQRLGRYVFESGAGDTFLAELERAVELAASEPSSAVQANALAALATGLHIVWRHDESLAMCERALEVARAVGAREAEVGALTTLGTDLAYLGRGEEGLTRLSETLGLAHEIRDPHGLQRAYVSLTDVLTMLGRPRESARVGEEGLEAMHPYGVEHTVLTANWIEALLALGEWDEAEDASAAALRAITANYPHMPLGLRADIELNRGRFDAARTHLDAARSTVHHEPGLATYAGYVAELALWEHRWTDADDAVRDGMSRASPGWGAQIRVWLCAKGLRAQAELAALARARRDEDALRRWLARTRVLLAAARQAAAEAAGITPNASGWLALAEAENQRAHAVARPELWSQAAVTWELLERAPVVAYCRWREAEALVAAGASRTEAGVPLRESHAVAVRLGARPLQRELELLAERARLDLEPPPVELPHEEQNLEQVLGLTRREAEVLTLVARGYTNREIAATLVISVKTASVHVSHILRKLDAPNRREAAAIAQRVAPPLRP